MFAGETYARVVLTNTSGAGLFTLRALHAMCRVDAQLRSHAAFSASCIRCTHSRRCCRSWSLANYVAVLCGRASCDAVTRADVVAVSRLLRRCVRYYVAGALGADCAGEGWQACVGVPTACARHNAVYAILHYLTDVGATRRAANSTRWVRRAVTHSLLMLPLAAGTGALAYYKELRAGPDAGAGGVVVSAMQLGVKQVVFDQLLLADTVWLAAAATATMLAIWAYTQSAFVTALTLVSMLVALDVAFVVYTCVFSIRFFPFVNLLAVVVLVAVGADGVFVFCRAWRCAKLDSDGATLTRLVADTLHQAALPICVTSLSTAAAFYANAVSSVTALGCFALFAGTTAIVNLFLLLTCLPAAVVVHEKWLVGCRSDDAAGRRHGRSMGNRMRRLPAACVNTIHDWARIFFEKLLPCFVVRLRVASLLLLGGASVCGAVGVFYWPRLRLPTSSHFQLFSDGHPFEVYDMSMRRRFAFERPVSRDAMPLTVVWGVKAEDNGDQLDPLSRGSPVYDPQFNMALPASQEWLVKFCRALRGMDLYQQKAGLQLTNCFIENFRRFMEAGCSVEGQSVDPAEGIERCCSHTRFPFSERTFRACLPVYSSKLHRSAMWYNTNPFAGPRFSKLTGEAVALVVEFESTEPFSLSYASVRRFRRRADAWVSAQMASAPATMRGGWLTSDFHFLSLQEALAAGVPRAAAMAVSAAAAVSLVATLDAVVSLLALLTVVGALSATAGILVLLGWQLDVVEAVAVSAAVGLSVDFTLHYGVAYRLVPAGGRQARVVGATARISAPVAMAMLTTVVAGALMTPATVLAYRRLGVFLAVVTAVSWCYATFFFQALLLTVGPRDTQSRWPCWGRRPAHHRDKTVYLPPPSTDTYELDQLVSSGQRDTVVTINSYTDQPVTATVSDAPGVTNYHSNGMTTARSIGSLLDAAISLQ